jgi:hypothetical protein
MEPDHEAIGSQIPTGDIEAPFSASDPFLAAVLKLAKPRPHGPKHYALIHGHSISGEPRKL